MKSLKIACAALWLALLLSVPAYCGPLLRGAEIPDLSADPLAEPDGYAKLGLTQTSGPVKLTDIKGEILILELFNRFCMSCLKQTAELEKFNQDIQKAGLADKIKILGIGIGNSGPDLVAFKKVVPYSYAVAPDQRFNFYYDIGDLDSAPTTLFLRRKGEKWVLVDGHAGIHGAVEMLVRSRVLLEYREGAMPAIDFSGKKKEVALNEAEKVQYAKAVIERAGGAPGAVARVEGGPMDIFRALDGDGKPTGLYAVVATRLPVCDLCHQSVFAIAMDAGGGVKAFLPIYLTKFGNEAWTDEDNAFLAGRLAGRGGEALAFNGEVDAVTSATISSSLIFDEARRASLFIAKTGAAGK